MPNNDTTELVASILTTDPAHCYLNRSVVLMVRDHSIDMRCGSDSDALAYIVRVEDIRSELVALHSFVGGALAVTQEAAT